MAKEITVLSTVTPGSGLLVVCYDPTRPAGQRVVRLDIGAVIEAAIAGAGVTVPVTPPVVPVPIVLGNLSLSGASFNVGAAAGTLIGTLAGRKDGSTLTLAPNDGKVVIDSAAGTLKVGNTASTAGTISYTVTETLAGATGSPKASPAFAITAVAAPTADTTTDARTLNLTANTFSAGGTADAVVTGTRDGTGLLLAPARNEGGVTRDQQQRSPANAMGDGWYLDGVSRTDLGPDADTRFRAVKVTANTAEHILQFAYARAPNLNRPMTASIWYRGGTGGRVRVLAFANSGPTGYTYWSGTPGNLVAAPGNADSTVTMGASSLTNTSLGNGIFRADVQVTPSARTATSEWNFAISPDGPGDVIVLGANYFFGTPPLGEFTSTVGTYTTGGTDYPAVTALLKGAALAAAKRTGATVAITPAGIATLDKATGLITPVGAGGRVTSIVLGVSQFAGQMVPRNALGVPYVFMPGGNDLSVGNGDGDADDPNGRSQGRWGESHPSLIPYLVAAFGGTGLKPILRIPFKWGRVQPNRNAALGGTMHNGKSEWTIVREIIERCCAQGVVPMPEPHNYNRRFEAGGVEKVVGVNFPREDLGDLWRRIMDDTASIPGIENMIVGSMNEPVEYGNGRGASLPMSEWIQNQNAIVAAVRNGGYNNLIAAPVVGFTHAYNLKETGYGLAMSQGIVDPANNWCFDLHEYFNDGRSGAGDNSAAAVPGHGAKSFPQARDLCEERTAATGYKHTFIVGENSFAGRNGSESVNPKDGPNTNAIAEATVALDFLQENRVGGPRAGGGTCLGYCYWKFNQRSADIGNGDDVNDADPPGKYLPSYPIGSYGPQVTLMRQRFQLT